MSDDEVENLYEAVPKKFKAEERHYDAEEKLKIKIPFQMCVTGSTGSGKTNALLQLVKKMNCFDHVMLWAKDTEESLYATFIHQLREAEKKSGESILTVSNNISDLPSVDSVNKEHNTLLIIDDMITEKSKELKRVDEYYIRGRKKNVSVAFLSQSYFDIPLILRKQSSYFIFTKIGGERDLTTILKDFRLGLDDSQIMKMYEEATTGGFPNFFMIDLKTNDKSLRFRRNYKGLEAPAADQKEGKAEDPSKTSAGRPGGRGKGQKERASGPATSKPELTNDQNPKKRRPLTKDKRFEKAEAEKKAGEEKVKEKGEERDALTADVNKLLAKEDPAFRRVAMAYFQAQVGYGKNDYYDAFLDLKRELPQLRREYEHDARKQQRTWKDNSMPVDEESEEDEDMYDESRMGDGIGKRRRVSRKKPNKKRKVGSNFQKSSKRVSLDQAIRRLASMI